MLFLRLQVAQQPHERLLERIVVLPVAEVADVAGTADIGGPCCVCVHYRVVNPNRKKHRAVLASFALERYFHFGFHPRASDRILRQDEEELVVNADSLVDAGSELVADLQILWRVPAADALRLEICVEPLGELLIDARMADEAGVKVEWLPNERFRECDEGVRNARAAQENLRDFAVREMDRFDPDRGWSEV